MDVEQQALKKAMERRSSMLKSWSDRIGNSDDLAHGQVVIIMAR